MESPSRATSQRSGDSRSEIGLDAEDRQALWNNDIQTTVPAQLFRLRYISSAGLIINTMIGATSIESVHHMSGAAVLIYEQGPGSSIHLISS